MNDNENLKSLYNTLQKEGYTPPAFEQFAKDMEDDGNLRGVYSTLQNEGYTPPDYDTFRSDMGFGNDKPVDLTAAKEGSEIGANAITNIMDGRKEPQPGKPKAQAGSHAQMVVDEYDRAAKAAGAELTGNNEKSDSKARNEANKPNRTNKPNKTNEPVTPRMQFVPEAENVVMATPTAETLKRYPWLKADEAVPFNKETGEPLYTWVDEQGNPISQRDLDVRRAKEEITGEKEYMQKTPASLQLPGGTTRGIRLDGSITGYVDNMMKQQYGDDYLNGQYTTKDGRQVSGAEYLNEKAQETYDQLNKEMDEARMSYIGADEEKRKELVDALANKYDGLLTRDTIQRSMDDGQAQEEAKATKRERERAQLDAAYDTAYARRAEAMNENMRKAQEEYENSSWLDRMFGGNPVQRAYWANQNDRRIQIADTQMNIVLDARKIIDAGEAYDKGETWAGRLVRGMGDALTDTGLYDSGVEDMHDLRNVKNALDAYEAGTATKEQKELLDVYALLHTAQGENADAMGGWYGAGGTTVQALPFMAQMAINPASNLGRATMKAATKWGVKQFGKTAMNKYLKRMFVTSLKAGGRVTGDALAAVLPAFTFGAPAITADTYDRLIGNVHGTEDEAGNIRYKNRSDFETSKGAAIAKAAGANLLEYQSEMAGPYFGALSKIAKTGTLKGLEKIGLEKTRDFLTRFSNKDFYRAYASFARKTQWHGTFEEYLEEVYNNVANAIFIGDMDFSTGDNGVFNLEMNLDTLLGVAVMSGAMSTLKTVDYARTRGRIKGELDEAYKSGLDIFGTDEWERITDRIDGLDDDKAASEIRKIINGVDGKERKHAVVNYAAASFMNQGLNMGELKNSLEQISDAAVNGGVPKDAIPGIENLTPEEQQNVHEDGMIHTALLYPTAENGGEPQEVFITKGNVVMRGDGTVDTEASSDAIYYKGSDGQVHMTSPDKIQSVNEPVSVEDYAATGGKNEPNMPNELNTTEGFAVGDEVNVNIDDEQAAGEITGITEDGLLIVSYETPDGTISSIRISPDELRNMNRPNDEQPPIGGAGAVVEEPTAQNGNIGAESILEDEYSKFVDTGIVSDEAVSQIADKIINGEQLTPEEESMRRGAAQRVEDLLKTRAATKQEEQQTEAHPTAMERIPKDGKGKPAYERADPETAWDAIMEKTEGDEEMAKNVADAMVKQQETELEKLKKKQPKAPGGDVDAMIAAQKQKKAAIAEAQEKLDKWKMIADTPNRRKAAATTASEQAAATASKTAEKTSEGTVRPAQEKAAPIQETIASQQENAESDTVGGSVLDKGENKGLTKEDADNLLSAMEERAEVAPNIELTPANWEEQFGDDGMVDTPIGKVKMGENQIAKLFTKGRSSQFGMIRPTLTEPDVVVEVPSSSTEETNNDVERPTSLLFIKAFLKNDGSKVYYFKSVTVKKDGLEVSVSSHLDRKKRVEDALIKGKLLYRFDGGAQTEHRPADVSVTTPLAGQGASSKGNATIGDQSVSDMENGTLVSPQLASSESKDTQTSANEQTVSEKIAQEEAKVEQNPTEAQKEAGNYKKGHIKIDGYDVTIENPKGSVRSGVDRNGQEWSVTMNNTYGYIRGTEGVDGDHIDVYLSDNPTEGNVFVIDQVNSDGSFDEHKVMYGFNSAEEARDAYLANYSPGWQGLGTITEVTKDEFKKWVGSSHRKTKPFAEYKSLKKEGGQNERGNTLSDEAHEAFSEIMSKSSHNVEINNGEVSETDNTLYAPIRVDGRRTNLSLYQEEPAHSNEEPIIGVSYYREGLTYQDAADLAEEYNRHVGEDVCSDGSDELAVNFNSIDEAVKFEEWLKNRQNDGVRFRKADDEISDFAQKHNLNRADVEAYADHMGRENLNGAARAFHEIRRKVRLDNQGASLGQFTKIFSPIEKELYDKFGNIDDLRQQYVQRTLDERNAMEAARKRAEEAAEAERRRLQEFQDMSDEQLDSEYIKAVEENDEGRMRDLVNEAARRKGYGDIQSDYQGVGAWAAPSNPGYESDEERRESLQADGTDVNVTDIAEGYSSQPDDYFTNLRAYGNDTPHGKESAKAINDALEEIRKGNNPKIKVYRAVPKSVKEGRMRNGDWVTPSRKYAEMHGDNRLEGDYRIIEQEVPANELWWDGNDLNEWGFDDGKGYAYRNTKNNRKLNDLITRDDGGNIIPLSQRFNARKSDVRYNKDRKRSLSAEEAAIRDAVVDRLRESGLEVITDVEEGQRVLDEANGRGERVRTQAMLDGLTKAANTIRSWIKGNKRGRVFTIELPESTQRKIKEAMGRDFDSHNITANGIAHALKNHGVGGNKLNNNSIPLREEDAELIPYIMTAPDYVKKASTDVSGRESVRFYKELSNGYVVVVEKEYKNSPDDMETITMWAETSSEATNARQETVPDTHVQNAILSTDAAKIRKDAETAIENDGKIREQTRFFRTADGEAYGFTVGGKIYIDPRVATADTPIHEYAHLWASALRQGNQEEWRNVVGLMKGTPVWDEVKRKYPELTTDDEIADEVLATYSGRRGAERLKEEARKATSGKPVTEAARAVTAIGRVREALRKFWQNVADFLHIHYTSAEEVADRVMRDLVEGVNPAESAINNEKSDGEARNGANEPNEADTPRMDDIRFRKADEDGNPENRSSNKHRELYEKRVNKRLGVFNRAWFDSMQPVKALQDAIVKETGQEIKPEENVYLNENRAASVAMRNHEVWERTHMEPVRKEIVKLMHQIMGGNKLTKHLHGGKTRKGAYNAVVKYMKSKHGLENNEYRRNEEAMNARTPFENEIEEVEKAVKDGKMSRQDADKRQAELKEQADKAEQNSRAKTLKKDYSGLQGIYGEDFERKAKEYVADFESRLDTAPFWREWNGATKAILKEEYDAGLISKELYDKIRSMYEYYIPLKGWAENRAEDVYTYYTTGSGDGGKPHRREGRTSESDDPLVILEQDADRQFTAAARNRMKQTLYNLATGHKTSLLTVRRQWYVNNGTKENPDWERRDAEIPGNATPEEMEKIISDFEKDMRKKQKEGTAMRQKKPMILPYHATKRMEKEHTVRVMVNGKEYVIYVNGDPAAAQAVNGTSTPKDPDNEFVKKWILGPWRWWMRVKASLLTAINLNFIPSNLSRDAQYSIQNMKAKEPFGYVVKYVKNLGECMLKMTSARLFYKDKKGTLDMNDPTERLFKEFLDNGGETGYTVSHTLEQRRRRNMAAVNKLSGIDWFKGWRMFTGSIEYVNRSVETIVRFSAYKTSREAGRSIPQSINDAKEASVNFDKHGSGELGNKEWRLAYIFANVQFQSLRRLLENASGHKVRFTLAQIERFATGFVVPMIAEWMLDAWGDDDEKNAYEELPEWMRQSGLAVPLSPILRYVGADDAADKVKRLFLYLPLGPEDKIWYALGEMSYHVFNSDMPTEDMAKKFGLLAADLLPVDFQGYGGNMLVNLAPSVVQDAVALEQNVDYWGRPIYKEDMPYNEHEPGHNKAFIGTPEWFVKRSKEINALTGGDDYTRGAFSPKPEQIEYAVNQTGGGVSRVITQLMSLVERAGEDGNKDVPLLKNIPVLSSIVKQSEPQDGQEGYDREKYYGYMDEYEKTQHDYKAYKKGAKGGDAEAAEKAERLKDSPEGKRMEAINEKIKKIKRKDRRVREIDRKEDPTQEEQEKREELKAESNELKQQLVEELDSISNAEKK